MAQPLEFALDDDPVFPDRCACCGQARETELPLNLTRLITKGQKQIKREKSLTIPLCQRCKRADNRVFIISLLSFLLGMAVVGGICFILILRVLHLPLTQAVGVTEVRSGSTSVDWFMVVDGVISLLVGIVGGFLLETIVKALAIPFLGKAIYHAPSLVSQMLGHQDYVAGVLGVIAEDGKSFRLTIRNSDIATQMATLNSAGS